jgi:hypothetical protein
MKKKIISISIIFILSLSFIGCIESNQVSSDVTKFIGVWETNHTGVTTTIEFFTNGSISITAMELTGFGFYEVKGETLILDTGFEGDESFYYKFSSDGKILTLRKADSDVEVEYIKQ